MVLVFAFLCRSVRLGNDLWLLGKNIVKGATKMNGHSLKQHFCMFQIAQVKHNNLDCYKKI
jgi:hypothetical protein